MKNGCREHRTCTSVSQAPQKMLEVPRSAGRNDGDLDGCRNLARQFEVVTFFCAVRIHACKENFSGAKCRDALRPLDSVEVRSVSPTVRVNPGAVALSTRID